MFYALLDQINKAYGQDEIDIGIETDVGDTGGVAGGGGGNGAGGGAEPSAAGGGGEQSGSLSSSEPAGNIAGFGGYLDSIIFSIIVVAVAVAAYFIINYLVHKAADSLNLDRRQLKGINSITKMAIIVISAIVIIFHFSSLSGVAAGAISVAVGTIIGFSSRNTISNAIAGILLLSARPFKLGDRIRTTEDESLIGDVVEISLLYTKIKTVRNELVSIPNQTLLQRQVVNYSGLEVLAITVNISMTYDSNRQLIEKLLVESAKDTEGIVTSATFPNEVASNSGSANTADNFVTDPFVLLVRFGDFGAVYDLRAYTNKPREFLKIAAEIRKKIYDSFQKHGLDLTVPQAQINKRNDDNDNDGLKSGSNSLESLR